MKKLLKLFNFWWLALTGIERSIFPSIFCCCSLFPKSSFSWSLVVSDRELVNQPINKSINQSISQSVQYLYCWMHSYTNCYIANLQSVYSRILLLTLSWLRVVPFLLRLENCFCLRLVLMVSEDYCTDVKYCYYKLTSKLGVNEGRLPKSISKSISPFFSFTFCNALLCN